MKTARDIHIRPLTSDADYQACVGLQEVVWGSRQADTVPPIIMAVCQRVGGIAAGAFDGAGNLVGCVFGLTGLRNGLLVHWSHLLAVRPSWRDQGVGRRLKLYQRRRLRAQGIRTMYWTFDPLVARNAHLNLNRLGAVVEEYIESMYGPGHDNPLDRVIGTDRFVVRWDLEPARRRRPALPAAASAPLIAPPDQSPLPSAATVRVAIPRHIHALRDSDPAAAVAWRAVTRRTLVHYLRRRYRVVGFVSGTSELPSHYVLARGANPRRW